jgi:tyrosine decarboxylase/aspartate 1-decarboxylase
MIHLGRSGFREVVSYCMDLTRHLIAGSEQIGINPVIEPVMNVVALRVRSPIEVRSELIKRGWHVSMTREPNRALRLILMPHMSHENIDLFLEDLEAVLKNL